MLLIAGLGNPGSQYQNNRHNIGFMAVEAIHRQNGFAPWRRKFQAEVADGTLGGEKVLLMKPMTYMNESGRSVGEAVRFYKLQPTDVIVIHDELDLPPAKMRMKTGGGHGGHNGLRSITAHIGEGYRRMRLGIGHPGVKALVHRHVLSDFARADADWLDPLMDAIGAEAPLLGENKDSTFANRLHAALQPEKGKGARKPKRTTDERGTGADRDRADEDHKAPDGTSGGRQDSGKDGGPLADALARLFPKRKS